MDWGSAARGLVTPVLPNGSALAIAVGIIGATVMPHAIFLHSGLTQNRVAIRHEDDRRRVLRYSNIEVVVALAVAGMVNMAMVIMAASAFNQGHSGVAEIETAYVLLTPLLGTAAASVFLVSLITSGDIQFGRRHHGRADDHAGFPALPGTDLVAQIAYHVASLWCGGYGL